MKILYYTNLFVSLLLGLFLILFIIYGLDRKEGISIDEEAQFPYDNTGDISEYVISDNYLRVDLYNFDSCVFMSENKLECSGGIIIKIDDLKKKCNYVTSGLEDITTDEILSRVLLSKGMDRFSIELELLYDVYDEEICVFGIK